MAFLNKAGLMTSVACFVSFPSIVTPIMAVTCAGLPELGLLSKE